MSLKELSDVTYFDLNNEINIPVNNQIPLNKDKEALDAFIKQNVVPNTKEFTDLRDRFDYLIDNDYIEPEFFNQYDFSFVESLYDYLKGENFHFKSFMAAYKFYAQYALKTDDNAFYLENYIDRVAMNALYFADGNEDLAMSLA
ncbi:MAG: class 1b ribonucleoside-diphosphate reductase subunit alpha, partial [Paucilactobacillus nenjiangensis]